MPADANSVSGSVVLSPGAQVGNYLIVASLGEGGTSMVYRATHAHVRREVALKVLGPGYPKNRFLAEARAIGSISAHPNIVEIYDCGTTADGQLYYVMELLQGRELSHVIGGRTMSPQEALPYLEQVCAGLEAAHRMGVVHRDVKLANIFVLAGEPLRLKLFDFGVARLPELLTADMGSTSQGVVIGTPTSMAPEQAAGQPERVGPQTDLYAVGVLLYQMLAGRTPFEAKDVATLLARHINDPPPPLAELAPVSSAISDVVLRCLAKDPADRYQSAEELYQTFSDVVNAELEERDDNDDENANKPAETLIQRPDSPDASWAGLALPSGAETSEPFELQRLPTGALEQLGRPDTRDHGPSHRAAWIGGIALLALLGGAWLLLRDRSSVSSLEPDVGASPAISLDSRAIDASATVDAPVDVAQRRDVAREARPAAKLDSGKPRKRRKPRRRVRPRRRKQPKRPTIIAPPPSAPDTGPPPTIVPPAGKVIDVKPGGS